MCVLAKNDGVVEKVTADKIIVRTSKTTTDEYELIKFMRSNQGTCINQRPIVNKGDEVKKKVTFWQTVPRPRMVRSLWAKRSDRFHDLGRLQLRGRRSDQREDRS